MGLEQATVTESALANMPEVVQRYMRFMGVVGRPRDWSVLAHLKGQFRPSPELPWMQAECFQYDNALEVARFFYMRIMFYGVLPVYARDVYLHGSGHMQGKALNVATVVDEKGPEIAIGELVTFLNDAILLAPSMLIGLATTWKQLDADRFEVGLRNESHAVRAQVTVDADGAPRTFVTTDRFLQDPYDPAHPLVRAPWSTPIDGYQLAAGRPIPTSAQAQWHLPKGDFAYARLAFEASELSFNVAPNGRSDHVRASA
ncbi:MAG: hypothetical protein QM778_16620 [Myxococcales bacterium]